jgi:CIC family chloride channel protein
LLLAFLKILATSFTIASRGSRGVFAPGLGIGALLGASLGIAYTNLFPGIVEDQATFIASSVIIGMMSLFAGVSKAPVAVLIMVSEMTGSYELIAPAMLSIAISYFLSGKHTIYYEQVESRGHSPAHIREYHKSVLSMIKVKDALQRDYPKLASNSSIREALSLITRTGIRKIPVVEAGEIKGTVTFEDIMRISTDKWETVKVRDVMNRKLILAYPDESLYDALKIMIANKIDQLPVVESKDSRRIIGILTHFDILKAHDEAIKFLMSTEEE